MNRTNVIDKTETIALHAGGRDDERKLEIVVTMPGGEKFKRFVWVSDRQERKHFLDELCASYAGIGTEEGITLRNELAKLSREHELDIEIHLPARSNGTCKLAIDYYRGSRKVWMTNGEAVNDTGRLALAEKIAQFHLGKRRASPATHRRLIELLDQKFIVAIEAGRRQTEPSHRAAMDDERIAYHAIEGVGLYWRRKAIGGEIPEKLTNFTARITANVERTDGSEESTNEVELEVMLENVTRRIVVKASEFRAMAWPIERIGGKAIVFAGNTFAEHARVAIQLLSPEQISKTVHTHTGWTVQPEPKEKQ